METRLSVIVPVHNEKDNVAPLVAEIFAALDGQREFELIYVDDGSTDGTLDEMRKQAKKWGKRYRMLRHENSCGQSTAVYSGAKAARYPLLVMLDGDGQNNPVDIMKLVRAVTAPGSSPDMAIGYRKNRRDNWLRRLSSRIANGVRSYLLNDNTPDTGCGLKAIRRDVFLNLPYFNHMHRFLPALVQRQGGTVTSIEVGHRPRERGQSKYGIHNRLWAGIVDLIGISWLIRRERRPLNVIEERINGS